MTKNTNLERNVILYIKKVIKLGHYVDIPCYINNDTLMKVNEISFEEALEKIDAGVLQILAPMTGIVNAPNATIQHILRFSIMKMIKKFKMHIDLIKVLAPMMKNPNAKRQKYDETTIWFAALTGNLDIIKFLAPLSTDTLNASDMGGNTAIHNAAQEGYLDIIKFLVPLTENPNAPNNIGITPIDLARRKNPWFSESTEGCDDIINILESHK